MRLIRVQINIKKVDPLLNLIIIMKSLRLLFMEIIPLKLKKLKINMNNKKNKEFSILNNFHVMNFTQNKMNKKQYPYHFMVNNSK